MLRNMKNNLIDHQEPAMIRDHFQWAGDVGSRIYVHASPDAQRLLVAPSLYDSGFMTCTTFASFTCLLSNSHLSMDLASHWDWFRPFHSSPYFRLSDWLRIGGGRNSGRSAMWSLSHHVSLIRSCQYTIISTVLVFVVVNSPPLASYGENLRFLVAGTRASTL